MTMSGEPHNPGTATWGCLGAGMILIGAFALWVYEGVGGTDYEAAYQAAASIVGGAGILLMFLIHSRSDQQKFRLPKLSVFVALAALVVVFVVLFFDARFPL